MPKFNINFFYNGKGVTKIEAKTKEEAEELFYSGEWEYDAESDDSDNYEISEIEEVE